VHTASYYGVIYKSLRDFLPQRYSSRHGHAEGEHVNRGRDTPIVCPAYYVLTSSFLLCLSCMLRSRVRKFRRDLRITLYIYFNFSTRFGQLCAHHGENLTVSMRQWYFSLCMGSCLVWWLGWDVRSCRVDTVSSPDNGRTVARNM